MVKECDKAIHAGANLYIRGIRLRRALLYPTDSHYTFLPGAFAPSEFSTVLIENSSLEITCQQYEAYSTLFQQYQGADIQVRKKCINCYFQDLHYFTVMRSAQIIGSSSILVRDASVKYIRLLNTTFTCAKDVVAEVNFTVESASQLLAAATVLR